MAVFGRSLATAQATAVALGVLSVICVHRAALWLGLSAPRAALGALVATAIPTAARLGVCAQPEALTAGLVVLGAAATTVDGSRRVAGAVALLAACLCRYEAWAAAAAFAVVTLHDAARGPAANLRIWLLCAAIALLAPASWIAHGAASHGDALFFLHRVAAYRRALGVTEPLARSVLAYPAALVETEPEVTLSALLVAGIATARRARSLRRFSRPALVIGAILAFLVVGRVLDGAPTHHAERTLLPVWTFLSLFVVDALFTAFPGAHARRLTFVIALLLGVFAVSAFLRSLTPTDPGVPRDAERAIGALARRHVKDDERLLVDTSDYGYFAVIAAFGAPERADPVERHDPRQPSFRDPLATSAGAAALLRSGNARWLVVDAPHVADASSFGNVVASGGGFSLLRVSPLR
jgi:hypothetical protein